MRDVSLMKMMKKKYAKLIAMAYLSLGVLLQLTTSGCATRAVWETNKIRTSNVIVRDVRVSDSGDIAVSYAPIMRKIEGVRFEERSASLVDPLVEGTENAHRLLILHASVIDDNLYSEKAFSPHIVFGEQKRLKGGVLQQNTTPEGCTVEHFTEDEVDALLPAWAQLSVTNVVLEKKQPYPSMDPLRKEYEAIHCYDLLVKRNESDWILIDIDGPSGIMPGSEPVRYCLTPFAIVTDLVTWPFQLIYSMAVGGAIPH